MQITTVISADRAKRDACVARTAACDTIISAESRAANPPIDYTRACFN